MRYLRFIVLGVLTPSLVLLFLLSRPVASGDAVADKVFGQGGSFTSHTMNLGGVSASSLDYPAGVAVDGAGNVYVVDSSNDRVLEFDNPLATDTVADRVFGQPDFTTDNNCYTSVVVTSASTLCGPGGIALDAAGNLYVADGEEHRVLEYNTPLTTDTAADRVFGQAGSFTTRSCNMGGPTNAGTLCTPDAVALDSAGNLYVADSYNARVLEYNTPLVSDTIADRVIGKPDFVLDTCDYGGTSASSLCRPSSVALDAADDLYVGDSFRLLEYNKPLTTDKVADRVFGQGGSFAGNACNPGGISASSICGPSGMALDASGNLYVTDSGNARLLEYDSPLTTDIVADRVIGQAGSFTTGSCNMGATNPSASSLCLPVGLAFDPAGKLYVADTANNRVLHYDSLNATPAPTTSVTPAATLLITPAPTPAGPTPTATPAPVGGVVDVFSGGGGQGYPGWALVAAAAAVAAVGGAYAWKRARRE
jgi:sugar lactone lactonase YvrE